MGVDVHMFIRGDTFLRTFDPMIQETMTKRYTDVGITIHKNYPGISKIEKVSSGAGNDKVLHVWVGGEKFVFNELLWAVGRVPETESLDLQVAGVKTGERGLITVDGWQNTSAEGVYALGDVTGQMELTPGMFCSLKVLEK